MRQARNRRPVGDPTPRPPICPSSRRLYPGWPLVAVCFGASFAATGITTYSLAVFIEPMAADLGTGRPGLAGLYSAAVVANAALAPFLGGLIDRRGARGVMVAGALLLRLGLALLATVQALWQVDVWVGLVALGRLTLGTVRSLGIPFCIRRADWFFAAVTRLCYYSPIRGP